MTTNTPRPGLRQRLMERWTPLFDDEVVVAPLTAAEFADACGWGALRAEGVVSATEDPLCLADLRLSTLFPRHLLRRRDDGRLVPIGLEEAVGLVRIALAQNGRSVVMIGAPEVDDVDVAGGTDATIAVDVIEAAGSEADGGEDAGVDSGTGGGRRRFFRRRPDGR